MAILKFEIPMIVAIKILVFWDVTPRSVVDRYCCLHLEGRRVLFYPEDGVSKFP
jgi:hypothetical protein